MGNIGFSQQVDEACYLLDRPIVWYIVIDVAGFCVITGTCRLHNVATHLPDCMAIHPRTK
jgi:hypothetical protein